MYSPGGWKSTAEGIRAVPEVPVLGWFILLKTEANSNSTCRLLHVSFLSTRKEDFPEKGLAPHLRTLVSSTL